MAGAAGRVRSSLNDMLKLMKVWLATAQDQFSNDATSTLGSPLKQVGPIMSTQILVGSLSYRETSYAMGWARTQIPGPLRVVGLNGFGFQMHLAPRLVCQLLESQQSRNW
jgi:hypothetical protein